MTREEEIKRKLNIESWRNLSKDKILNFMAELSPVDRATAIEVIKQFPNFRLLADDVINSFEKQTRSAHDANWKSQKKVHEAHKSYREALDRELQRDDLDSEERQKYLDMMRESVSRESEKDSEQKDFTLKLVTVGATVAAGLAAAAIAALGGKAGFGGSKTERND